MVQKHTILRKRANPVQVNLPNRRSFASKWERISRKQLPINIKVTKNKTIGPRRYNRRIYFNLVRPAFQKIRQKRKQEKKKKRQAAVDRLYPVYDRIEQAGSGLGENLLKPGFDLGSKVLGSDIGKKLINKGIDNIPNIFKFGASKIKNKNVKKALESEIADMVVNKAQGRARKKYNSTNLFG